VHAGTERGTALLFWIQMQRNHCCRGIKQCLKSFRLAPPDKNTHTHTHGEESFQKVDRTALCVYGCSHEAAVCIRSQTTSKQMTGQ
jgi:hypothetical protein